MTPHERFLKHVKDWKDCRKCGLCDQRSRIVLARGKLPCDVLLVGEAPGDSEDVLGLPFVGPAGKLLDEMVRRAFPIEPAVRLAFTNLVACYPREAKATGNHEPTKAEIKACQPRLIEFVAIARPKLVVTVGNLATTYFPIGCCESAKGYVSVTHPAAILRANQAQQSLMIKRVQLTLANAYEEVFNA